VVGHAEAAAGAVALTQALTGLNRCHLVPILHLRAVNANLAPMLPPMGGSVSTGSKIGLSGSMGFGNELTTGTFGVARQVLIS
jgi:3-oxoacyl-(acyl-carrier-protein) synthase